MCKPLYYRLLLTACLLLVLTGCESMRTVMTQHKVVMEVESDIAETSGSYFWQPTSSAWPFDYPGYQDMYINMWVGIYLRGLDFNIVSTDAENVVFRWDEARLGVTAKKLQSITVYHLSVDRQRSVNSDIPVQPVPTMLQASSGRVSVSLDYSPFFDSPYVFGTKRVEQGQGFIDDGVGRSMVLELPIEYDGHRVIYRFTFTATDVQQWNSYH